MPKELEETQAPPDKPNKMLLKKYGADNWYDWRIKHWGTKWDVDAELVEADEERLVYQFDSAWSPPFEWLKTVARNYPKLHFKLKYDEPGMGVMGVIVAGDGEINYKELTY